MKKIGFCDLCPRYANLTRIGVKGKTLHVCGICLQKFVVKSKKKNYRWLCDNCKRPTKRRKKVNFDGKVWKVCPDCYERFRELRA